MPEEPEVPEVPVEKKVCGLCSEEVPMTELFEYDQNGILVYFHVNCMLKWLASLILND